MSYVETLRPITGESLVGEILSAFPVTLSVFVKRRMHCPGCRMASFMTVAEAAANYGLDPRELAADLNAAIAAP